MIVLFCRISLVAGTIEDIDQIKERGLKSDQIISVWIGSGLGLYFASDDMHSYIKNNVGSDAWNSFLGMSGKICIDLRLVPFINFEVEGEAFSSINLSGSLFHKHAYHKLSGSVLPGIRFSFFDASYIISAGPLYSFHYFKEYQAQGIAYRLKVTMLPYVNGLTLFTTTRGFIVYDYGYEENSGFELGGWGIQIGAEFHVL